MTDAMTNGSVPALAAIDLKGVGKRFTKYEDTPMLITSASRRLRQRTHRDVLWAVRGVDLTIPKGSTYGIIGRNGSGKTTLLSMMAGVTAPTEGSVRVWGRTAPLIAVGVGFHRELTGRENVYLNGTMLGLERRQIDERLDAIIEFSEIGDFLDTPVKFYSSGMYVRLGFSVAIHCDPDVLLVDEVLAVGDLGFQMKCFERMRQLRERGTTSVVISHNLSALQAIAEQILVMKHGQPVFFGPSTAAISYFHELLDHETETRVDSGSGLRYEPGIVKAKPLELLGPDGAPTSVLQSGVAITIRFDAEAQQALDDVIAGFSINGPDGQTVYTDTTADRSLGPMRPGESATFSMDLFTRLPSGSYTVRAWLARTDHHTVLARSRALSFYVAGRVTVQGAADLQGVIGRAAPSAVRPEGTEGYG
ncbi:MAG: ABC transporter ATP-binding protein [Acidimicrobiales bacterium]